ncbi:hypothetical protein DFP73DRAFT_91909 [Morchella snyderi]|nr:hypothetical protein DFP73DRAFT_91909 [Morchella snyderi]
MTRREQGYLRIAINVFFFQYHFCYHFKFILVRISTTPFLRLCHFFFPMMGGIWALLGVLFLLLSMLVSAWYRGRGKMLKGVEVDVEGKTDVENNLYIFDDVHRSVIHYFYLSTFPPSFFSLLQYHFSGHSSPMRYGTPLLLHIAMYPHPPYCPWSMALRLLIFLFYYPLLVFLFHFPFPIPPFLLFYN